MSRSGAVCPFLAMIIFSTAAAAAIPGWYAQPNPAGTILSDIQALDANTAFAVGANGTILKTTDGGQTWTKLSSGTTVALSGVSFLDANKGWAAGEGTVLSTTDGGATWTPQSVAADGIDAIAFPSASVGVAVGYVGSQGFLRTADGGAVWTEVDVGNSGANRPQDVFFLDAQHGWAVGINADYVTTTCDWGSCYTNYHNPKTRMWSTSDGGATWTTKAFASTKWLRGVAFVDANTGWVVGDNGLVWKTADGGANWTAQTTGTVRNLNAVDFVDASNGWAAGAYGEIWHTADGGATWALQVSGVSTHLYAVDFVSATTGWAAGVPLLRTDNGGTCTTVLSPTSASIAAAGDARTVTVTSGAECTWTAVSNDAWIAITSGSSGSGNGGVAFAVDANGGTARVGSIEIAGIPFRVVQLGPGDELKIRLLAGGSAGSSGYVDGVGTAARFSYPRGVSADTSGNVYVADTDNHAIRKVTPSGSVTTLAGGTYGSSDGTGTAARFNTPSGVAVDGGGNVFVADSGNHTIRKITPAGVVTTLAGLAGNIGSADGNGSEARFYYPRGLAVDTTGTIYIADADNNTIRKLTPSGDVTTLAGLAGSIGTTNDAGSAARFNSPRAVAVDGAGNLYVADTNNYAIRKVTSTGVVTTYAGVAGSWGTADGTLADARFSSPGVVAIDTNGDLWVADAGSNTIRKVTPSNVSTIAGLTGTPGTVDGTGSEARFDYPRGIAVDASGNVYVGDSNNNTIRKMTTAGVVTTLAGPANMFSADGTGSAARFRYPYGVAVDASGTAYVADTNNNTVRKVTDSGVVTTFAGLAENTGSADGTGSAARFNRPRGVALDGSGNVYVADTNNHVIRMITPGGAVSTIAGTAGASGSADGGAGIAQFNAPWGIAVDGSGNVYVGDSGNHTIRMITGGGAVSTIAGTAGSSGTTDGNGPAARFNSPHGVAVDSIGNVYVADTSNHAIRRIAQSGEVTTFAGLAGVQGSVDGTSSLALFNNPQGVAIDGAGGVYVADTSNQTIRHVTPAGIVVTVAGLAGYAGAADGTGSAARFSGPAGVALDAGGNVYVADSNNFSIRTSASAFAKGDVDGDGTVGVADLIYLINTLFANGPAPAGSGDVDGDGNVDINDVFYLLNYLFAGGAAP